MGRLSTHVLDTTQGRPAEGVRIELHRLEGAAWVAITEATTNADGRTDAPLLSGAAFATGTYMLTFHVAAHFASTTKADARAPFLDAVPLRFTMAEPDGHYHVPLLVTPWSYATYRGS